MKLLGLKLKGMTKRTRMFPYFDIKQPTFFSENAIHLLQILHLKCRFEKNVLVPIVLTTI